MPFRFDIAPRRIYWELTRACDLACAHCRASASPSTDPRELTTPEIFRVIEDVAAVSAPSIIFTGGDPLKRADFFDIVAHTGALGFPCSVAPSATPLLTRETIASLTSLHISAMSLSLDGSTAARHDALRGVEGTFEHTRQIAREVISAGIPAQINTLITGETVDDLPAIDDVVRESGAQRWSLSFLVSTGRARAPDHARACGSGDELGVGFAAQTAGRHHHRGPSLSAHRTAALLPPRRSWSASACDRSRSGNPGRQWCHVHLAHRTDSALRIPSAHRGQCADGASSAGLSRAEALSESAASFTLFGARCGRCEFRDICGGSRARAYAATGDPFGSDPLCSYVPPAHANQASRAPTEARERLEERSGGDI
jgi:MoaA/NifB/PqqE/SkfB family radical SAM enzyme